MADFQTGAELEISVSQSSLSDARDTIESELGDIEVDVNAVVSGGSQPRDPSSGQFLGIEGVEQRVVNTNDTLDGLIQIESERWELDKIRNDYLEQLADTSGLPGQRGGGGGGVGMGAGMGARAAIGAGTLSTVLGATALAGTAIFGGRAALSSGVVGETGQRVARERNQLMGGSGLQMLQENPGQWIAQSFMTGIDPTGIGETMATNAAQGIMDQTTLDENFSKGLDAAFGSLSSDSYPALPNLSEEFEWPQPDFDFNPFDGGAGGGQGVDTGGLTQRGGPQGGGATMETTVNVGGVDVQVPIDLPNVGQNIDNFERELEQFDQDLNNLERRVAKSIEEFF